MTTLANRPHTALLVFDVQNAALERTHERDAVVAKVGGLVWSRRTTATPSRTPRETVLSGLGVGRLVVVGAHTDWCVRSTLHGALARRPRRDARQRRPYHGRPDRMGGPARQGHLAHEYVLSDAANWPRWAVVNVLAAEPAPEPGWWRIATPQGAGRDPNSRRRRDRRCRSCRFWEDAPMHRVVRLVTHADVREESDVGGAHTSSVPADTRGWTAAPFAADGDANPRRISVSARHEAVLDDGSRLLLLDDRGWTQELRGAGADEIDELWAITTERDIVETARMVVGPDEPFGGRTQEVMETSHWNALAEMLRAQGVVVDAGELRRLPHEVELSDRLRARVGPGPGDAAGSPIST